MLHMAKTIQQFFPDLDILIRSSIPDPRAFHTYSIVEIIMACIAMFLFKEGSRNAMNQSRKEGNFYNNYKNLLGCELPHQDTVEEVLRVLDEKALEKLSTTLIKILLKRKVLHKFRLFKKYFIIAIDATGVHTFAHEHCDKCLTKTSKKNEVTNYFHNVLEAKLVAKNGFSLSLGSEWIENAETDYDKQDCEMKAFKRLAESLKMKYSQLTICVVVDGLYPNSPFFKVCEDNNWKFICALKDSSLSSVQKKVIEGLPLNTDNHDDEEIKNANQKITRRYSWLNDIQYGDHIIHWTECIEIKINNQGEEDIIKFVYLTNFKISQENIKEVIHSGRLRQKIENEGFNTQKNLGYALKHKYSRTSLKATKIYYQCLQIAHIINQLMELSQFMKCRLKEWKNTLKHSWKCIYSWMTEGKLEAEDLSIKLNERVQYRY